MKRIIKSRIFIFILGAIIFGSIGSVVAYNYSANQISYSPKDENWDVSTVKEALNDLRDINNSQFDISKLSEKEIIGGTGTTFDGLIPGHKYISLFVSNHWDYSASQAHINSGAKDIKVIMHGSPSGARNSIWAMGAVLSFTATDSSISLVYENSSIYYAMYFIDLTA